MSGSAAAITPLSSGGNSEVSKPGPTGASTTFRSLKSHACCVPPMGAEP